MANCLCFSSPVNSLISPNKPGTCNAPKVVLINNSVFRSVQSTKSHSIVVKAGDANPGAKTNSLVCAQCDGNGALACSQCDGTGVNSVDHFQGRFKAGGLCWLCRGKKEMLCGSCNGAGFMGGFMSTFDE
ncbi:hypothetical protein IFM89_008357 [Coptis chinensis]|uniref:BSD2 cysteine rich domain-containing protein n=1 Tax=Coptis chinensis TaxID=261450 RepID=A0A835LZN9_9MAGN|nr:hypothetical protein IFM89_008357 [Coptis chinensis]